MQCTMLDAICNGQNINILMMLSLPSKPPVWRVGNIDGERDGGYERHPEVL